MLSEYIPLDFLRRLRNEEPHRAGGQFRPSRVDGDLAVAAVVGLDLDGEQEQLQLHEAQLRRLRERHPREGGRQRLRVHLASRALQVVVLPLQRVRTLRMEEAISDLIMGALLCFWGGAIYLSF